MTNSDLATARWAVALEGEPFDIEDARGLFAKHDEVQIRIIEVAPDRNPTVLLAKERSEEHTSELQSRGHLVCRLLLEKKKKHKLIQKPKTKLKKTK